MGALRIFTKDLFELFHGMRGVALVLVLPPLLMLLVGQLRTQPQTFRVLVVGAPTEALAGRGDDAQRAAGVILLLREVSLLDLTTRSSRIQDPLAVMREQRFDLLLDLGCGPSGCPPATRWRLYTAETDTARFAVLKGLVSGLERVVQEMDQRAEAKPFVSDVRIFLDGARRVAATRPLSLFVYYPPVDDPRLFLLPMTISLIVSFLPFALAVSALIREREPRMLEILLTAPRMGPANILAGKAILPLAVTLLDFLVMVVLAQSFYGLQVKAGLLEIVLFLLPATLASTMAGLLVSASASSQPQALLASAIYFLMLTLVTGLLLPLGEASRLISGMSHLLPMTFVLPAVRGWMFGAHPLPGLEQGAAWLGVQCVLYGVLAIVAFRSMLRRL